jgi:putative SOS response-associated peptidase YedK
MCGRFTLWIDLNELVEAMPWLTIPGGLDALTPRYNIAPTQPIAVVPNNGERTLDFFVWGLIPSWAKDPKIGSRMINARGETVAEKPSFRAAYRRRRCLILADGFYEWQKVPGQKNKQPVYIHLKSGEPFAFAGLWEYWQSEHGDEVLSATIITTTPNDLLAPIHNRMPVILPPTVYDRWLDPGEQPPDALDDLLAPYPASELETYPVSTMVNSPANDMPECIEPLG